LQQFCLVHNFYIFELITIILVIMVCFFYYCWLY